MVKLRAKGILHYYKSKDGQLVHTLDKINLEVKEREFLAIVGPSGCGKSTLLNILSGMLKPTCGQIEIDGEYLDLRKHKIGYISQSDTLLPWRKIIDNVAIGLEIMGLAKKYRHARAKELMKTCGLAGFEDKYPYELSGGMKKRAIIIRALATDPDIIFMDEPFGPLDVFTKNILQEEILAIWEEHKKTIVYITHDIGEAINLSDRIIVMGVRPAKIKAEYIIDMVRPRDLKKNQNTCYFKELENLIWQDIVDINGIEQAIRGKEVASL